MNGRIVASTRGVLLVGGDSRRFGSPKQLAAFDGESFAERIARTLSRLGPEPLVAGSGDLPPSLDRLERCADIAAARGPIAGILGAFEREPDRALLVVGCDQPLLSWAAVEWLLARRRAGAIAVVARLGRGGIEPLPALYEPGARAAIERLRVEGGSLQPLGGRADVVVAEPPPQLARAWLSIDTLASLREIESPEVRSADADGRRSTIREPRERGVPE